MKRWLMRLLVLFGATILACLLAEVGVLVFVGEQVRFPRHVVGADFGLRINQPGATYRHKSPDVEVWFRINSKGLRADVEYPYEKPEGVLRIVSLGDSFTIGYEVEAEETFAAVLERELRAAGLEVEVLNAGVSGYSTAEEVLYLERELIQYDPDLVLVSFYGNDLRDNVRTGLFRLEGEELVEAEQDYVPLGGMGDFLNTNPLFAYLSAYSNAFAYLKETTTLQVKRKKVRRNVQDLSDGVDGTAPAETLDSYEKELACALFQRLLDGCQGRGIPVVIQSIPSLKGASSMKDVGQLQDKFPYDCLDLEQEGLSLVAAKKHLEPFLGKEQLYWFRSHRHWTPFSHRVMGRALAEHMTKNGLFAGHSQTSSPDGQ